MILIISGIIVFFGLIVISIGMYIERGGLTFIGLLLFIFGVFVGFGILGTMFNAKIEVKEITKFRYAKLDNSVAIECGDKRKFITGIEFYNNINDSSIILLKEWKNSYGQINEWTFIIKK